MKKKRMRIIAAVLTGVLLVSLAIPAALAERAQDGTNETEQTETAQTETMPPECGRQRSRSQNGADESAEGMKHGGRGSHARPEEPAEPAEPDNAIGKDAAKEIALNDAGLTSEQAEKVRARLSDKDGTLVYKVSFRYDGQKYSYRIDPVSGEILDRNVGEASEHTHGSHARPEEPAEPAEPDNAIGKDAAKEIALTDAGLTAEQVEKVRARLSDKDGTLVYKVSFRYDGQRYSYRIDPVSGEIIDKTVGEDSGHDNHGAHRPADGAEAPEISAAERI